MKKLMFIVLLNFFGTIISNDENVNLQKLYEQDYITPEQEDSLSEFYSTIIFFEPSLTNEVDNVTTPVTQTLQLPAIQSPNNQSPMRELTLGEDSDNSSSATPDYVEFRGELMTERAAMEILDLEQAQARENRLQQHNTLRSYFVTPTPPPFGVAGTIGLTDLERQSQTINTTDSATSLQTVISGQLRIDGDTTIHASVNRQLNWD